jgi:hypothetical protein
MMDLLMIWFVLSTILGFWLFWGFLPSKKDPNINPFS